MRILFGNWSRRKLGGAETYIEGIAPALDREGHQLAFLHDVDTPLDRGRIELPEATPTWCVAGVGAREAIAAARAWRPDVLFLHSYNPSLTDHGERDLSATLARAIPTVFFCHDYVGACISGAKTFKFPVMQPCSRRFGWPCLVHYYPHHCGGFSPVSMWREYRKQDVRLDMLRAAKAIVTASSAMRDEYLKHGFGARTVHRIPYFAPAFARPLAASAYDSRTGPRLSSAPLRLLFAGRMDRLKGGSYLLDALPRVVERLARPVEITFAGDGEERAAWVVRAAELEGRSKLLKIHFPGWLPAERLDALLADCHLAVVPSVWPEPFGLVGIEAGLHGVPAAAFNVGGIASWLEDGVNGYLAPGDPPRAAALADAIVRCLGDEATYAALRAGAYATAAQFTLERHLESLMEVLAKAANG